MAATVRKLTTPAPDIAIAIRDETLPLEVTLFELAEGTPVQWGAVEEP